MEEEIRRLEARSFQSWENEFTPQLMMNNKLIRIGCATFTMKRHKHRSPTVFQKIIDRHFYRVSKKLNRHIVYLFGQTPTNAKEKTHQHGDIFIFDKEGTVSDPEMFRWLLEAEWKFGICQIEGKNNQGNWTGYSVQKHDGNDDFLKVYCPKTGDCGKHTKRKGDRRVCVYQREAITVK